MRLVDSTDAGGVTTTFEIDEDGNVLVKRSQVLAKHFDANRQAYNAFSLSDRARDIWRMASIPAVIVEKWLNEDGINVFRKSDAERVRRKLNDPEWRWLRTAPGKL